MTDLHTITISTDEYGNTLGVNCPYDPTDPKRPCWPWQEDNSDEGYGPTPAGAPGSDVCTYENHIDSMSADDVNISCTEETYRVTDLSWDGDGSIDHVELGPNVEVAALQEAVRELHGFIVTHLDPDPEPVGSYIINKEARVAAENAVDPPEATVHDEPRQSAIGYDQ